jgi:hypothetical protein
MYLAEAEKEDKELTEAWKGEADSILVFVSENALPYLIYLRQLRHLLKTGLFSATVAAFIIESYKNLSPSSGDTTVTLLAQISQQLAGVPYETLPQNLTAARNASFKPTNSAVRVNVLWFLSLVLSLTSALSATLLQQWARRYLELTQHRGAPHKRARIRAYVFDGVQGTNMYRAVEAMPLLLHISVFLFLAGLVDFLFPINDTVAFYILGYISAFISVYAILTVLPNLVLNCPYRTPLSGFAWRISQVSALAILLLIRQIEGSLYEMSSSLWHRTNRGLSLLSGERRLNLRSARVGKGLLTECGGASCAALLEHHGRWTRGHFTGRLLSSTRTTRLKTLWHVCPAFLSHPLSRTLHRRSSLSWIHRRTALTPSLGHAYTSFWKRVDRVSHLF